MTAAREIEARDGRRVLTFTGTELGSSSSERAGARRWIEFTLYKTAGDGQYVLSRVGVSRVYHLPECRLAAGKGLPERPRSKLGREFFPCDECKPDGSDLPIVCVELDKTWARVYRSPAGVIQGLTKTDEAGESYLTGVARRLLEQSGAADPDLASVFRVQTVT